MSNEQKPSAEALTRYVGTEGGVDVDPDGDLVCLDDVIELLARVRREARAEAFEEAVKVCEHQIDSKGDTFSYSYVAGIVDTVAAILALAAKERA